MSAPKRWPAALVLPPWFRDEDQLRRLLALRRDGHQLPRIREICGVTAAQWTRVRAVAKHSPHAGDRAAAAGFLKVFDAMPVRRLGTAPMFSPEDGARLAAAIGRWKLPDVVPHNGDAPL